jgi:hypothetical protein
MILPIQAQPVIRFASISKIDISDAGVIASAKKLVTGMARCTKGGSLLFTGSQTICTQDNHDGCTAAKVAAVNSIATECSNQGGVPQQSTSSCSYGAKC